MHGRARPTAVTAVEYGRPLNPAGGSKASERHGENRAGKASGRSVGMPEVREDLPHYSGILDRHEQTEPLAAVGHRRETSNSNVRRSEEAWPMEREDEVANDSTVARLNILHPSLGF